jgi:hypothetical protein
MVDWLAGGEKVEKMVDKRVIYSKIRIKISFGA